MAVCILAIESSCDDTSVSVISDGKILSNITATQLDHSAYGGVIPELASRAHLMQIIPVVQQALIKSQVELSQLNAIAFTKGPGLIGSLLVGSNFAKGLALSLNIPLIEVHHMQAHILAHFIDDPKPKFPFLCLTVSGGHTQLVLLQDHLQMRILGQTIDDAAGEAFDKAGKLLGLPYPAGPWIDKYAKNGTARFSFPSPQVAEYDFSFSG
ncbi:MAG: tRNA (adenosine(37)-N6)-threonylcarbamoyltransferase complex transferase subunit TsaD, partial [Saprospiraceae bacterium]